MAVVRESLNGTGLPGENRKFVEAGTDSVLSDTAPLVAGSGLEYFESLAQLEGRRFSPLESARIVFAALGNPQDQIPSVHVAGTNGKGTVSALVAAMLLAAGKRVGQTCSPHLTEVNERCLVNGAPSNGKDLGAAIEKVVAASQLADIHPSYFVLGLAACYCEFARLGLDWSVIEVGLGGRHDATNLMKSPAVSVITNISFDHVELLGTSLGEIAANKAGILKSGVPVFVGEVPLEARQAIEAEAAKVGTTVEFFGDHFTFDSETSEFISPEGKFRLCLRYLSLAGKHQCRNAVLAARVAQHLGLSEAAIHEGLQRVRWPGRLEFFPAPRTASSPTADILLDVAHNPGGIDAAVEYLGELFANKAFRRLVFVLSVLDRKDWRTMFSSLRRASEIFARDYQSDVHWIFTTSGHGAALDPFVLAEGFPGSLAFELPEEALAAAKSYAGREGLVVVTGSVFLVGRLRPLVTSEPFRSFV